MICDLKECGVCFQNYDSVAHLPMALPQCGHTICKECCDSLFRDPKPKCPFDRKDFLLNRDKTFQMPQVNNYALKTVEKLGHYKLCEEHNKSLEYLCSTDKQMICIDCFLKGTHKKHDVIQLEDVKEALDEKCKKLEDKLGSLDKYQASLDTQITKRKFEMLNSVDEYFKDQVSALKKQKQETQFKIIACFENERKVVSSAVGRDSNMRKGLNSKIAAIRDGSHPDLPDLITGDTEEILKPYDEFLVEENRNIYPNQLDRIAEKFKQTTEAKRQELPNLKLPSRESLGNQEIRQNGQPGTTYIVPELNYDITVFEVESYILFAVQESKLRITLHKSTGKRNSINMDAIKQVTSVTVDIAYAWLLENDLAILNYVISQIEVLEELVISIPSTDTVSSSDIDKSDQKISFNMNLKSILEALFLNLENITTFKIDWLRSNGNSLVLNSLYQNMLVQPRALKRLRVSLNTDQITDFTVEDFLQRIQPLQGALTELNVYITKGKYALGPVNVVLNMPLLKCFKFRVKNNFIMNQNCENFLVNSLPTMKALKSLAITMHVIQSIAETKLLHQINVIKQLKEITNLSLYVSWDKQADPNSPNHDKELQKLLKKVKDPLLKMKKLKSLHFGHSSSHTLEFTQKELKALK